MIAPMETFVVRAIWSDVDGDVHGTLMRVTDGTEHRFVNGSELLDLLRPGRPQAATQREYS